jgi:serine/threonine protein kinase
MSLPRPWGASLAVVGEAFGSWQLDALIAVGGLGEVWRASRGGMTAAIKRLHTHLARNDEALAQFTLEQRLSTTLPHHTHVVHAHETGDVDGRAFIALELLSGFDVRRLVVPAATRDDPAPARQRIARERALAIVLDACAAAAHMHANGWVHGDINPSNLVVDGVGPGERYVLIDLGVARAIGEAGSVRGTHAYMAPEQVRGEAWTPATDVFALGVVLWELIAGARLFHRGPTWLSMAAVIDHEPAPLADRELDAIAKAALVKDPAHRLATALDLAARLRDLGD